MIPSCLDFRGNFTVTTNGIYAFKKEYEAYLSNPGTFFFRYKIFVP